MAPRWVRGCHGHEDGARGVFPGWGAVLVSFSLSPPGGRSSHFSVEDLKSLGRLLCDTLLDFCDPAPTKVWLGPGPGALVPRGCGDTGTVLQLQQCLAEADALLQQQMGREPGSGSSWSDVSPSELESRYVTPCHPMSPRGATGGCRWFFPPAAPAALTAPCPTGSQMASTALTRQ